MRPLTIEQCEASHVHPYREPTEADIREELEQTPLGMALLELLALAQDVDCKAARREVDHVVNGRRHMYRCPPNARLAATILNAFGPPEDCFVLREIAESLTDTANSIGRAAA